MGRVVNATPRPLYLRERFRYSCIGGWVGPRGVCRRVEYPAPTEIWSPDCTARIVSLYWPSYPGPMKAEQFRLYRLLVCRRSGSCQLSVGAICGYELRNIRHVLSPSDCREGYVELQSYKYGYPAITQYYKWRRDNVRYNDNGSQSVCVGADSNSCGVCNVCSAACLVR